jgi:hypothetical protein
MPTLFEGEEVVLYPLRRRRGHGDDAEMVIADTTFVRCRLLGPIHLRLGDDVVVEGCTFEPSIEQALTAVDSGQAYVGAFAVIGCSFVDCEFDDVRLVVAPDHALVHSGALVADAARLAG